MTEPRPAVPAVDIALDRLETLAGAPPEAHVDVYDHVHGLLQEALATLDEV